MKFYSTQSNKEYKKCLEIFTKGILIMLMDIKCSVEWMGGINEWINIHAHMTTIFWELKSIKRLMSDMANVK